MWIQRLSMQGVSASDRDESPHSLERVGHVAAATHVVTVCDAIELAFATIEGDALRRACSRLGLGEVDVFEERGFPETVSWTRPHVARALFAQSTLRVDVQLALDPTLFRMLMEAAAREPRLADGVGAGGSLELSVGWHLSPDAELASVGVLRLAVGEVAIPMSGAERPAWTTKLLRAIARRVRRLDPALAPSPERLLDAITSADVERRRRARSALLLTGQAPFRVGETEVVRSAGGRVEVWMGSPSKPLRTWGPRGAQAVALVEAVLIDSPDVLVLPLPTGVGAEELIAWLGAQTQGEGAALEQVIFVGDAHG